MTFPVTNPLRTALADALESAGANILVSVRRCTVADIEAAVDVVAAYERECAMPELGAYRPDWQRYRAMEAAGFLLPIGTFDNGTLVGLLFLLVAPNPHLGALGASVDSFFVVGGYRCSGAGMAMLAMAESVAFEQGARALFVSARVDSTLAKVMRGKHSYKPSNEVFCKVLVPT